MVNEEIEEKYIEEDNIETYGYGDTGNLATLLMFEYMLNEDESKEYRQELKKQDKKAYDEYVEFEKEFHKQNEQKSKSYSHKPHLADLPYDHNTNDSDKLEERLDAINKVR